MTNGVWVRSGPGIPNGARRIPGEPAREGCVWLDMCSMGQHLPQMYRETEVHELTAEKAPSLGLCPDCLGFGEQAPSSFMPRSLDEIVRPCPNCGGSGRPALRVTIRRDGSGLSGDIRIVPHAYVPPPEMDPDLVTLFEVPADMCLACGNPRDWHSRES